MEESVSTGWEGKTDFVECEERLWFFIQAPG